MPPVPAAPPQHRLPAIDAARAAALAAMAAYHTLWDLGHLRLTPENYALTGPGRLAAHGIAGGFLLLVGVGLVLMNGRGVRVRPTLLRLARIGGAALLITLATAYAFPDSFIFFGILHCIAVSGVLALPFLALPGPVTGLVAALVVAAPHLVRLPWLDAPALFFLGL
ncbi:heparan-alpha-glucosaminide N-acetyltransferase domain-containing protein, partial [Methylobacterium trifolii]